MNDERLKLKKTQLKLIVKRTKIKIRTSTNTLNHQQQRRQQLLNTIQLQQHQQLQRRLLQLRQQRRQQQPHQLLLLITTLSQPMVTRRIHKTRTLSKVEIVEMQMHMEPQPLRKLLSKTKPLSTSPLTQ